jgi:hypothetical protein
VDGELKLETLHFLSFTWQLDSMKEESVGDFTDMGKQWPWKISWLEGFHLSMF